MPFLSFCIPTFKRKKFLQKTLESILSQIEKEVEIVISDNCSLDGTKEMVEGLGQIYPFIVYTCFDKTVPCGENLLHVVSQAKGEYCWLMTDDDQLEPHALKKVLDFLKKHPGISGLSVNVQGYTQDMSLKKNIFYSQNLKQDTLFFSAQSFYNELGAWIGFWSAQIVQTNKWKAAILDRRYLAFEGYHHLFIIAAIVHADPCWGYMHQRLVGYRSDNESFAKEYGKLHRFFIDLQAYEGVGSIFFSPEVKTRVKAKVLRSLLFWQIVRAKVEGLNIEEIGQVVLHTYKIYSNSFFYWFAFLPLLFTPKILLKIVRPLFKLIRKCYG
jgi:abequosyltransferase